MMKKPTDVAWAIFENSARGAQHVLRAAGRAQGGGGMARTEGVADNGPAVCAQKPGGQPGPGLWRAPFLSGFVQRFIRRQLSRMNSIVGFLTYSMASADMPTYAATALSASRLSRRAAQRVGLLASAPGLRRHVASSWLELATWRRARTPTHPLPRERLRVLGEQVRVGHQLTPRGLARRTKPWGMTTIFLAAGRPWSMRMATRTGMRTGCGVGDASREHAARARRQIAPLMPLLWQVEHRQQRNDVEEAAKDCRQEGDRRRLPVQGAEERVEPRRLGLVGA